MKVISLSRSKNQIDAISVILFVNRISLSLIFFWFGLLKVASVSPAEGLVKSLYSVTISNWMGLDAFVVFLGLVECLIGVLWLFPKWTKLVLVLFSAQMLTTFMPLVFLTGDTWHGGFVLTLTGQYIIKNVVLIASALTIYLLESQKREA
ncbi:MAG: hypothetical protein IPH93_17120 [Saprospiraceae bacterium]|nr:hypothetical protein [Saprospiraceae bacterium]MBK7811403.1 hypothetical protein [Saprospiraceae bacterium]